MDRELLQDSDGVNESFWDGQGVEIEATEFLERIWGCGGFRYVERIPRVRMVLTRASRTARAFLDWGERPPRELTPGILY